MGVPRPTEMTIRDLLQEELRKRGVAVVPEFLLQFYDGYKYRKTHRHGVRNKLARKELLYQGRWY